MNETGNFIISLDFELHWGGAEKWNLEEKKEYFNRTRKSIPLVLNLFEKYGIHATWATVGFLFAKDYEQLMEFCPKEKPTYNDFKLSYYNLIENKLIGDNETNDPYHYAHSLIEKIIQTPNQELATHTFGHFYCNEPGQTISQFDSDLKSAQKISMTNFGIKLESLVLPRNQFNSAYLEVAFNNGIKVVRSNPDVWFWKAENLKYSSLRAIDAIVKISKTSIFSSISVKKDQIMCLPASRFLRPYTKKEGFLEFLKFQRIKIEMIKAARTNSNYHLWWHPHNFGNCTEENLRYLEKILKLYKKLNSKYGFKSKTMIEMYSDAKTS